MRQVEIRFLTGAVIAVLSLLNQGAAQESAFEVASVRINKAPPLSPPAPRGPEIPPPPPPPFSIRASPGTLTIHRASLVECLVWAYGVRPWQISAAPDWFASDRFDILARAAVPVPEDQMKKMLQHLLANRFHLALHWEQKETSVVALSVDTSGPKFKAASSETAPSVDVHFTAGTGGVRFSFRNQPLDRLEGALSAPDWGSVVNMTGLAGRYDFTFERPQIDDAGPPDFGAIRAALQRQLGLKLERRKVPIDFLVIDQASRIPAEN